MSVHHDSRTWPTSLHPWLGPDPRTGSSPMWAAAIVTAPQAPASASGGRSSDDVGRQQLGRRRGRGAEPRQLAMDRRGERGARVGDAAADDDPLDVVGHDEEVDRPGEPAADVVDEVRGVRVADWPRPRTRPWPWPGARGGRAPGRRRTPRGSRAGRRRTPGRRGRRSRGRSRRPGRGRRDGACRRGRPRPRCRSRPRGRRGRRSRRGRRARGGRSPRRGRRSRRRPGGRGGTRGRPSAGSRASRG